MGLESLAGRLTTTAESPWRQRAFDTRPFRRLRRAAEGVIRKARGPGMRIYEDDWDLLVVVDACRHDLLCEVAPDYGFLDGVGSVRSRESMTRHWMRENFVEDYRAEMATTAYVSGNPISGQELDDDAFAVLDEPWRYAWDLDELHTLPARPVTDRSVRLGRSDREFDRLLVHYLQPHCPFLSRPDFTRGKRPDNFTDQPWDDVWMRLEKGELPFAPVWEAYRANLEYVLDEVELLLANVDADRAVLTSDHGNAAGEWNLYGHPPHHEVACLRDVPWVAVDASDEGTHEPDTWAATEAADPDLSIEDRLAALGYTE